LKIPCGGESKHGSNRRNLRCSIKNIAQPRRDTKSYKDSAKTTKR
jgi:hypothetical protein